VIRYWRIMGEQGLTRYVDGTLALSAPMGRQKPGKIMDLLQEIADTESGP
jgi:hypothetical protein